MKRLAWLVGLVWITSFVAQAQEKQEENEEKGLDATLLEEDVTATDAHAEVEVRLETEGEAEPTNDSSPPSATSILQDLVR